MGQYVAGGRFDLILSFRYHLTPAQLDRWKLTFQKASELLYAATDGQQQLGTLWVCTNSTGGLNADFWLFDTPIGSAANARIWEPFLHGQLDSKVEMHPFTIVHELGHYLYSLGDEYKYPDGPDLSATCVGIDFDDPPNACIMEAGSQQGDRWGPSGNLSDWIFGDVHEFCVAANHDQIKYGDWHDEQANNTVQSVRHGESCWETMERFYPDITAPALPVDARSSGAATIDWIPLASGKRYVFIADLSALDPYVSPRPLSALEHILFGFVRTAPRSEYFGAVITLGGKTWIGDLNAALAGGLWPGRPPDLFSTLTEHPQMNLGEMLGAARSMIEGEGPPAATQVAAFVSFGTVDVGPDPYAAAEGLREHGIRLYTFGKAPCWQRALLNSLAAVTGGSFSAFSPFAQGAQASLRTRLAHLYHQTHEEGGLVTVEAAVVDLSNASESGAASGGADGELELHTFSTPIEEGCSRAVFTVEWFAGAPFEVVVVAPGGREHRESKADTKYRDPEDTFRLIEVAKPEAGTWSARVVLRRGATPKHTPTVEVQHRVHVGPSRVKFALSTPQPLYALGETVRITGLVAAEAVLSGVPMHGTVTDPSGRVTELELTERHADRTGGRGVGSGCHCVEFTPLVAGPHEIVVVADNMQETARVADGGDSTAGKKPSHPSPDAFVRHASMTVLVANLPARPARARPGNIERGEKALVEVRFGSIPWVPGVSRLWLGSDIRVREDLPSAATGRTPAFTLRIGKRAVPGARGAVVITGGKRYWIPRLIRVDA